jgi:hypothetical protein
MVEVVDGRTKKLQIGGILCRWLQQLLFVFVTHVGAADKDGRSE